MRFCDFFPIVLEEKHPAPGFVARIEASTGCVVRCPAPLKKIGGWVAGFCSVETEISSLHFIHIQMMLSAIKVEAHLHIVFAL